MTGRRGPRKGGGWGEGIGVPEKHRRVEPPSPCEEQGQRGGAPSRPRPRWRRGWGFCRAAGGGGGGWAGGRAGGGGGVGAPGRRGGRGHTGAAAAEEGAAPEPRRRLAAWSRAAERCRPPTASDLPGPRTPCPGSPSARSLSASGRPVPPRPWVPGARRSPRPWSGAAAAAASCCSCRWCWG